jgi:hypothetical protein
VISSPQTCRKADADADARCPEHHVARHPDSRRGREVRAKAQLVAGAAGRKRRGVEDRIDAEQPHHRA